MACGHEVRLRGLQKRARDVLTMARRSDNSHHVSYEGCQIPGHEWSGRRAAAYTPDAGSVRGKPVSGVTVSEETPEWQRILQARESASRHESEARRALSLIRSGAAQREKAPAR